MSKSRLRSTSATFTRGILPDGLTKSPWVAFGAVEGHNPRERSNGPANEGGLESTKTTTKTSHYHVQKARRAKFLEDWRGNHRTVIRSEEVKLQETARGMRTGVYMGEDGDNPTRSIDALVHEVDEGRATTIHRHSRHARV